MTGLLSSRGTSPKIESFEEAFLAHIVLPDGATVGSHAIPAIAASYKGEKLVPLLPGSSP